MKFIKIEMLDKSVWEIPARIVALHKATYYADKANSGERNVVFAKEFEFMLEDDDEIIDWLQNNMDWSDIKSEAHKVTDNVDVDYEDDFCNREMEVVDRK